MADPQFDDAGDIFAPIVALPDFTSITLKDGVVLSDDAVAAIHGSTGLLYSGDGVNQGEYGIVTFTAVAEGYWRFYIRVPTAQYVVGAFQSAFVFYLMGSTTLLAIGLKGDTNGLITGWRITGQGLASASPTLGFVNGSALWVDVHWKAGGPELNGGAQVWVNGVSIFTDMNQDLSAYTATRVFLGNTAGVMASGHTYHLRDLVGHSEIIGEFPFVNSSVVPPIMLMQ